MTLSEKNEIIIAAKELINLLENCDDYDFVDFVLDCVASADSYPLDVEKLVRDNMTVFEKIKSMNIDEFARWFEENCTHDNDPCIRWFSETYCENCEPIMDNGMECSYCELNGNCKFFENLDYTPSQRETIKVWLNSETD